MANPEASLKQTWRVGYGDAAFADGAADRTPTLALWQKTSATDALVSKRLRRGCDATESKVDCVEEKRNVSDSFRILWNGTLSE